MSNAENDSARDLSPRERVIYFTKHTGVIPCIKLHEVADFVAYARAMYDGGARIVEVTMTTPRALDAVESIAQEFGDAICVSAGTVLDASTARQVILAGGQLIMSPVLLPEVVDLAHRYNVACYPGVFSATECLTAMRAGADALKIFPAGIDGPKYMTNLRMVFPAANLVPSGGVSLGNVAAFVRGGACAVSGARAFMDHEAIAQEGLSWITRRVSEFVQLVREAKADRPPLP